MKHLKTQKQLSENQENLNISDVRSGKINELFGGNRKDDIEITIKSITDRLDIIKNDVVYSREDMIKIEFIDGLLKGKDMELLLKSYKLQMKNRFH
jgi:hypothetical protein